MTMFRIIGAAFLGGFMCLLYLAQFHDHQFWTVMSVIMPIILWSGWVAMALMVITYIAYLLMTGIASLRGRRH